MTFEENIEMHRTRHATGSDSDEEGQILHDWKAEREERAKVYEAHATEAEKQIDGLIGEKEKLIAEVERLRKIEGIAESFVGTWNEFEQPMPLEWDMPDPMRTIHEWASEWKRAAEKAEIELQSFRSHVYDNIAAQHEAEARVTEKDREIERLRERQESIDILRVEKSQMVCAAKGQRERAEKAEADLKIIVGREQSIIKARDVHLEERRRAEDVLLRLVGACDIAEDVTDTVEYQDAVKFLQEKSIPV